MLEKEKETAVVEKNEKNREKKNRKWLLLLFLALLLVIGSTCMTSYILGKKTSPQPAGQPVDTILLTPEAEEETETVLHLTGRVRMTDGTPAVGRTLELHSDPMRTVTNSTGSFLFYRVEEGEHHLLVMNSDGSTAASRTLQLERGARTEGVSINMKQDGIYVVELAVNVRILELSLELEEDSYEFLTEFTYATTDGMVVTPTGRESVQDGPVFTPGGNIYLSDGTVVLPEHGIDGRVALILPDDTLTYLSDSLTSGGLEISPDGTVTLPDKRVIHPGGDWAVTGGGTENDAEGMGGAGTPVISEPPGATPEIGRYPTTAGDRENGYGSDAATGEPGESGGPGGSGSSQGGTGRPGGGGGSGGGTGRPGGSIGNGNGSTSGHESTGSTESSDSTEDTGGAGIIGTTESSEIPGITESSDSTVDKDNGILDVSGQKQNTTEYISWKQSKDIDLFYNREGGSDTPIAPGAKGFYRFRLKNTRQEKLYIQLIMTEGDDLHLPLSFTLTPQTGSQRQRRSNAVSGSLSGNKSKLTLTAEMEAGEEMDFVLDWEWPPDGNDKEDTDAGRKNGDYKLTLTIHAEGELE